MIGIIGHIALLTLLVNYVDFRLTKTNYGAKFNGIGSIPDVLAGKSLAPMQYRVFVPWVCSVLGKGESEMPYLTPYLWVRGVGIAFSLSMAYVYFGILGIDAGAGVTALALFFCVASLYDYSDVYYEVGFVSLSLTLLTVGGWAAIVGLPVIVLIAALNRETIVVVPLVALLGGQWVVLLLTLLAVAFGYNMPHEKYGHKDRYCKFNQIPENIKEIVKHYKHRPAVFVEYTLFFALCVLAVWAYATSWPVWGAADVALGLLGLGLLVPTKWREIRVFAPCMLAIIPMVVR